MRLAFPKSKGFREICKRVFQKCFKGTIQHHRIVSRTTMQHELVTCLDSCSVRGDSNMFGCIDEVGTLLNKHALQKPWSVGSRGHSYRKLARTLGA